MSRERGGRLEREERQFARVHEALKENLNIRQTGELCDARPHYDCYNLKVNLCVHQLFNYYI